VEMLAYLADHQDVKTILVETASRFARDTVVQITGYQMLKERGILIVPVDSPTHFLEDTPTAKLIRVVLGGVSEFEKGMLVLKLRVARERKRALNGKCEGRKTHAQLNPNTVALARKLHRKPHNTDKRMSYRDISAALAAQGHLARSGKRYGSSAIKSMVN
jgi:DNA invertase Pin-like site-specific DNA recombinase